MPDEVDSTPDHRRRVGTLLGLLADEHAQNALSGSIGRERLAFELSRAWFDDVYVPSNRYLEGLKGDFVAEAARRFEDAFDPVELAAMERFHRFFELRIDMLPEKMLADRRIPLDERWKAVMKDAAYLLEDLEISLPDLRRRIDEDADALSSLIRIGA